ncbi:hypothetical protein GCM10011390_27380 [Aureimonas endophytica]|uniref:LPS-assembly lipoprotein n=1 Tax=Aureimonas endophytica TaxID=2027858 RepID=A0A917E657_9HYPH|nr:LPS assembly lipoprotein LptE [Aureimonas endophytica]GGE06823.1 hypothetical protein GCM10011390_27380 [Aureimonas endophytica]
MSFSDRRRFRRRALALGLLAGLGLGLSACTVHPLYGTASMPAGAPGLAELKGRVDVAPVGDRTSQIVRNALLFGFNGGETPIAPLYRIAFTALGQENVVSIQQDSGIPAASIYKLTVNYTVTRTTDTKVIATGTRFADAPFDRNRQLFAATRAYRDAQERAGKEVAEQMRLVVLSAIRKDLPTLAASVPQGKS